MGERPRSDLSDLIDWRSLRQLSDGDAQFERELLALFVDDTEKHLGRLSDAIAGQDPNQIRLLAHYLKGSCGNVGVMPLHHHAATLETSARRGELSVGPALLDEMQRLLYQVQQLLHSLP
jgi:HPt (histidine-containing phosphotransfer) domain-containing protein